MTSGFARSNGAKTERWQDKTMAMPKARKCNRRLEVRALGAPVRSLSRARFTQNEGSAQGAKELRRIFVASSLPQGSCACPRRESNPHQRFRKPLFYPLNYGDAAARNLD